MPTRRHLLAAALLTIASPRPLRAQTPSPFWIYPIARPGRTPGDGFLIRHGYATENTWYLPGYWHTGEDWYALDGATAGADILAVAPGEVVFAGSDYPGRVVILRHAPDLYSMSGHLDDDLPVTLGQTVERGDRLGRVLARGDAVPDHLHFEIRTFLTTPEVNGPAPRYPFACGPNCPPGPGYWPIAAPDHPSALGWRNPTHVIAARSELPPDTEAIVAASPATTAPPPAELWSAPEGDTGAERLGDLPLAAGDRFPLLAVDAGPAGAALTSAAAYRLWYRLALPSGEPAWVRAAIPSTNDTGSDRRPSSIRFDLLPIVPPTSAARPGRP